MPDFKLNFTDEIEEITPDAITSMSRDLLICSVLQTMGVNKETIDAVARQARIPKDEQRFTYSIGMLTAYKTFKQEGVREFDHQRPTNFESFDKPIITYIGLIGIDKTLRRIMGSLPITYQQEEEPKTMSMGSIVISFDRDENPCLISGVPEGVNLELAYPVEPETGRVWIMEDAITANSSFDKKTIASVEFPTPHNGGKLLTVKGFQDYATARAEVEAKLKLRDVHPQDLNQNFEGRNFNPTEKNFRDRRSIQMSAYENNKEQVATVFAQMNRSLLTLFKSYEYLLKRSTYVLSANYIVESVAERKLAVPSWTTTPAIEKQRDSRKPQPDCSKLDQGIHASSVEVKQASPIIFLHEHFAGGEEMTCDTHGAGEVGPALYPFPEGIKINLYDAKPNANTMVREADLLDEFKTSSDVGFSDAFPSKDKTKEYFLAHEIPVFEEVKTKTGVAKKDTFNSDFSRTYAAAHAMVSNYKACGFKLHVGAAGNETNLPEFLGECISTLARGKIFAITRFCQRTTNREATVAVWDHPDGESANGKVIEALFEQINFATLVAGEERRMREIFEPSVPVPRVEYDLYDHWAVVSGDDLKYLPIKVEKSYTQRLDEELDLSAFSKVSLKPNKKERGNAAPVLIDPESSLITISLDSSGRSSSHYAEDIRLFDRPTARHPIPPSPHKGKGGPGHRGKAGKSSSSAGHRRPESTPPPERGESIFEMRGNAGSSNDKTFLL